MYRILLVDDEEKILPMVKNHLYSEGFQVQCALNGEEALRLYKDSHFDLVVLDLMMPRLGGLEVLKEMRMQGDTPVILLTARSEEVDRLLGLELGADDYLVKPFSMRELAARIRAVLRRSRSRVENLSVVFGNLRLDLARYEAFADNLALELTPTEFKLLAILVQNPGQVFSRLQLLERVYGDVYEGYERSIDTHMSNMRRKLEGAGSSVVIKTVYGIGYKLEEGS